MKTLKLSIYTVLIFLFSYSCRKTDIGVATQTDKAVAEAFLQLPANADPLLIRVTEELRKQNDKLPFIQRLVASVGMPRWDFTEMTLPKRPSLGSTIQINSVGSTQGGSSHIASDTTVLIPFVFNGAARVNSFLAIHLSGSVRADLFRAKDYQIFGYDRMGDKPTALDIALRCMSFDKNIFKSKYFRIIDKRLASELSGGRDTSGLFMFKQNEETSTPSTRPSFLSGITTCTEGIWIPDPAQFNNWNPHEQDHPPLVYIGGQCFTSWYSWDLFDGSYIPKQEQLPTGGGLGVTSYTPQEYPEADRFPEPWEETDEQGFYLYRKQELERLLTAEPFNVINCDSLNIMPLDDNNGSYGLMFKRVAQKQVTPNIRIRLDSIANVAPSNIFSTFQVQTIEDAYGPVVNCDYFAVHISTLPTGVSADQLLDFFRKYTNNNFVDASTGISFGPYIHGSFSDAARFYSPYEQSIGALVHIDLGYTDGTVVTSDYYRSQSPQPYKSRFMYSTISSPLDIAHPVSGNREFGIFANPGGNGYTFYTMGVDRTTNIFFGIGNTFNMAFNAADNLWKHVQQKMTAYVNNNGGQAFPHTPIIARPRWDRVEKYLRGQMTFSMLKQTLGCQ